MTILGLLAGFVLLVAGGESLVRGAGSLARTIGMSSLVVGLTVVSFATSAPELAVSVGATFDESPGLAVGNVVGSNIANILLVLGLSAVFVPLIVKSQIVRADIPVMLALTVGLLLVAVDGTINRFDGLLLLGALVAYVTVTVIVSRRRGLNNSSAVPATTDGSDTGGPVGGDLAAAETPPETEDDQPARAGSPVRSILIDVGLVALGVVLLVGGAQLLVTAAREIASTLGVSDLIIGLTVVAIGTSLPELATSVVAVIRGERDLAIGNIVGSNVFNIGAVLGVTALVSPDGVDVASAAVRFDLPIMLAVSLALLPVAFTGFTVARWEGALFVGYYTAYVAYLVLDATDHDALESYSAAMLWFVVPITALWLIVLAAYEVGLSHGRRAAGRPELHHSDAVRR